MAACGVCAPGGAIGLPLETVMAVVTGIRSQIPRSCGRSNNRLPDGYLQDVAGGVIDTKTDYDGREVKIMSSLPPKNSRIGQKSKCAELSVTK